jgi:uncharacterized protein DUF4262
VCWQCDNPDATQEDYFEELRAGIERHGWVVQYVDDDRRPFAYTVGLHRHGLAELLVTGLDPQRAAQLLNAVAEYSINKVQPRPGETMSLGSVWTLEFVRVTQPSAHLVFAIGLYGPEVRALQVVWLDDDGHSPWCPIFDGGRGSQPVLGTRYTRRTRPTKRSPRRRKR